jgi:hypothetical protein
VSNKLPPGWAGNDARHHVDIADLRLSVVFCAVRPGGKRRYRWNLPMGSVLLTSHVDGHASAALARAEGLASVEAFARKLLEQTAQLRAKETA